nr:MAG: RNA-dependent RNA polymerase [Rhizoctonia solani mitovirus 42]
MDPEEEVLWLLTMLITLILITASLSLVRYLEAETVLADVLTLPLEYYLGIICLLVLLRLVQAINKYIPVIKRCFKALERVGNNSSAILQRLDRSNGSNGINKSGKRSYSTQIASSSKVQRSIPLSSGGSTPLKVKDNAKSDKFFIKDLLSAVRINSVDVNAMSVVKDGIWWVNKVVRLLPSIGLSCTGPRVRAIVVILRKFAFIGKTQGIKGLVIHLKACHVCLTQACAGHMIKDVGALNCRISRNNRGLPRLILAIDRNRIRRDDFAIIKFYQTLFGMYRILSFEGKLKINSITAPFSGSLSFIEEISKYIPIFIECLMKTFPKGFPKPSVQVSWKGLTKVTTFGRPDMMADLRTRMDNAKPIWLAKSASGTHQDDIEVSSHPFLMLRTAATIAKSDVYPAFKYFQSLFRVNHPFNNAFNACVGVANYFKPLFTLGKLGIKEEAAGKVRVFAMVPTWFQNLLAPLHEVLFKILGSIPQDGTFNQLAPLRRMSQYTEAFSLDLTAATDRLPLVIQVALLTELFRDSQLAQSWAKLLAGIEYSLNNPKYAARLIVKYAVGQPMGALSSWAMLAFTHHFLVQVSAWRSGVIPAGKWFRDYAILGDDLVIFNRVVALEYIKVIRNIGMEIGLHKSVLSRTTVSLEFAKRIFHKGVDVSAVPFKEFFASLGGFGNILEFANKYKLSKLQIAKTLGFRFKSLSKINHGFNSLNYKLKQLLVAMSLPSTSEAVIPFLQLGSPKVSPWPMSLETFFRGFAQSEFKSLLRSMSRKHTEFLASRVGFFHFDPQLENDPLFKGVISSRFLVNLSQFAQDGNWASSPFRLDPNGIIGGKEVLVVEGPAEAKEDWSGFVMLADERADIAQPMFHNGRPVETQREHESFLSKEHRDISLTEPQVKEIRRALAALWDFQILPLRDKLQSSHREIAHLLAKNSVIPEEMAQVFISFLETSREAALVPTLPVSLARVSPTSRGTDPISIRMWKRWSKFIQGTVHGGFSGAKPKGLKP